MKINKVNLYLQSLWGSKLSNVRGSVIVDGNEQLLPVIDFKSFEEVVVEANDAFKLRDDVITGISTSI